MPLLREVNLSSEISQRIKKAYWDDKPWIEAKVDVSRKLAELIKLGEKCFPDQDRVGVLLELRKFSAQDILDAFEMFHVEHGKRPKLDADKRLSSNGGE